jgi:hypothetical protein
MVEIAMVGGAVAITTVILSIAITMIVVAVKIVAASMGRMVTVGMAVASTEVVMGNGAHHGGSSDHH